jgi:hypothetical protein
MRPSSFDNARDAKAYLETLLRPHFVLQAEVRVRHLEAGNRLRIDYLGRPRPDIELPFPFEWFGIEVKKTCLDGSLYNDAIRQAIHYTHCVVDDDRPLLERINGQRIERVYIFPARGPDEWFCDAGGNWYATKDCKLGFCVNRLAGKFHVGAIYEIAGLPAFYCSADRQWSPIHGAVRRKHNSRQTVGNGALRRDAALNGGAEQ